VAAGVPQGRRPELQGGGLLRSLGGWVGVTALRQGREAYQGDARILGGSAFVAAKLRAVPPVAPLPGAARVALGALATRLAADLAVPVAALGGGSQTRAAVAARQLLAYVWVEVLGRRASELARALGQSRGHVSAAARRGAGHASRWAAAIPRWCR
jgi:putative transposase